MANAFFNTDLHFHISWQWCHNGRDSVSNHQPHDCLLNSLFGRRSKKTSKFRVTGLCVGNSPGTGEFPVQRASNAENVSIWWRHHVIKTENQNNLVQNIPVNSLRSSISLIARFMGPTWGPSGADRTQVGPMSATWTLLSGMRQWTGSQLIQIMAYCLIGAKPLPEPIMIYYQLDN